MRRNLWLSLSFANLVYLRAWADLLPVDAGDAFYRKTLPGISLYCAVAADVLLLSILAFIVISVAPKLPAWLQRILLALAVGLVVLALVSLRSSEKTSNFLNVALFATSVVVTGLAAWFSSATVRLARMAAMAATPCLAVTFLGSLFYLHFQPPVPPDPPLAPRLAGSPPVRVIWIIFDEWDQRITFPERSPGLNLPTVDTLALSSFTATHAIAAQGGAVPVADMATVDAVPSLLYGKLAGQSQIHDAASREIAFRNGGSAVLGEGDNIFAEFRSRGWNAAIAGWYLPYCRLFASQLVDCYWDVRYLQRSSAGAAFPSESLNETRMLFETPMTSIWGPSLVSVRHQAEYSTLMDYMRRYAADPSIGLVFLHINVPHVPYFYDPKVGRFGHYGYSRALYDQALQWVDRSVASLLITLKNSGLDSSTALILSSDHPLRSDSTEPYVPFIVHFPGELGGMTTAAPFSTLETPRLALAIAERKVTSPADIMAFLAGK